MEIVKRAVAAAAAVSTTFTTESIYASNAGGTVITSGGSTNSISAAWGPTGGSIETNPSAWYGFWIVAQRSNSSSVRYMLSMSIDGSTVFVPELWFSVTTTGLTYKYIPLYIPAGSNIQFKLRASTANSTIAVSVIGRVFASSPPTMFTSMAAITADTANTRPSTQASTIASSGSYSTALATLASNYSAFMLVLGEDTSVPSVGGTGIITFGVDNAGGTSYAARVTIPVSIGSTAPAFSREDTPLFQNALASGATIAALCSSASATGAVRVGAYGFA